MTGPRLDRRSLLVGATALGGALTLGRRARAARARRVLVLVELTGGMDGLATVLPRGDDRLARLRPGLVGDNDVPLARDLALPAALAPLAPLWRGGELAVVEGVGRGDASRSHFRERDVWARAGEGKGFEDGWLARALRHQRHERVVDALVLAGDGAPAEGHGSRTLHIPAGRRARMPRADLDPPGTTARTGALQHLLTVQRDLQVGRAAVEAAVAARARPKAEFPRGPFGQQLAFAARALGGGLDVGAVVVRLDGWDTHARQVPRLAKQHAELAGGLVALREALLGEGLWASTTVLVVSEFGRRVARNASGGTDHGGANVALLAGGAVRGGRYGQRPPLDDLVRGDLRPTTDFRRVYAAVTAGALGLGADGVRATVGPHRPLAGLYA